MDFLVDHTEHSLLAEASNHLLLRLARNDVALLASALRETLEAVEDWEFETRVGESRERAREAMGILWQAYDETRPPQT